MPLQLSKKNDGEWECYRCSWQHKSDKNRTKYRRVVSAHSAFVHVFAFSGDDVSAGRRKLPDVIYPIVA